VHEKEPLRASGERAVAVVEDAHVDVGGVVAGVEPPRVHGADPGLRPARRGRGVGNVARAEQRGEKRALPDLRRTAHQNTLLDGRHFLENNQKFASGKKKKKKNPKKRTKLEKILERHV
jgi:hypothetical protein